MTRFRRSRRRRPRRNSASLTISALRCCAAIWSCLILASASSRAFCSETTLNFSTAPATAPSSSLRPRPGSTTAKLPPASSSIDTLNARIGRAIVKKENMLVPISNSNRADAQCHGFPFRRGHFPGGLGGLLFHAVLGEIGDLVGERLEFGSDRQRDFAGDADGFFVQLRNLRCGVGAACRGDRFSCEQPRSAGCLSNNRPPSP